jgi:hypothetical protein
MFNQHDCENKTGKIQAETLQKTAKLYKTVANTTYFHSGVEQVVRFLKDDNDVEMSQYHFDASIKVNRT